MIKVVFQVEWDTDGESPDLPNEFTTTYEFPENVVDAILETVDHDALVEALTDEYGYCISSYSYTVCS